VKKQSVTITSAIAWFDKHQNTEHPSFIASTLTQDLA